MIKLFANNLVEQSVISTSSENLLFPKSNLKHPHRTKVFRSLTNSSSVIFDFQETSEIDSILVVPNKMTGFGFSTLTLELNATSNFTSPAFSISVPINLIHGLAKVFFGIQEFRFAKLVMTSSLGFCELSKVFIGKSIEFTDGTGIDFGWKYQDDDNSIVKKNRYGQKFTDLLPRQKNESFAFKTLNQDEMDQIFELYDTKGITKPFFMYLGTEDMINDPDRFSGMFYLRSMPEIINKSHALYDIGMTVEEAM